MVRESESMPIMFLGGPLDHAVRRVRKAHGTPAAEVYKAIDVQKPMGKDIVNYDRMRIEGGTRPAWCYILRGYNPPRGHVVDAIPPFVKKESP